MRKDRVTSAVGMVSDGSKMSEYEASNDPRPKEQDLYLMEVLRVLISSDDTAIEWAELKDALCFVIIVVDRIPTPVLEECTKTRMDKIRQELIDRERIFLRALLELYRDMPLQIPTKESTDFESYRRLEM